MFFQNKFGMELEKESEWADQSILQTQTKSSSEMLENYIEHSTIMTNTVHGNGHGETTSNILPHKERMIQEAK